MLDDSHIKLMSMGYVGVHIPLKYIVDFCNLLGEKDISIRSVLYKDKFYLYLTNKQLYELFDTSIKELRENYMIDEFSEYLDF